MGGGGGGGGGGGRRPSTKRGTMDRKISIVVPAFNEEKSIPVLHGRITKAMEGLSYEVIFVDDGSSDGTAEVLKGIAGRDRRVKGIRLRKNCGKATAYSAGFGYASGEVVVTMDADLQDDPAEIHRFLEKLDEGYDLVNGWKYKGKGSPVRAFASTVFNRVTARLTGIALHDFNCPFKAYRREVVGELVLYGDLFRFIPVLVSDRGYRIGEVTIENYPREHGRSRYGVARYIRTLFDLVTVLFLTRFKKSPLYFFGSIGLAMALLGFLIDLYLTYQKAFHGMLLSQQPLLLLGILLIVLGVQFTSIGLITEMIVSISHEGGRVRSLIREVIGGERGDVG